MTDVAGMLVSLVFGPIIVAAIVLAARKARSTRRGIFYGMLIWVGGAAVASVATGFLSYVLPAGQMPFVLARAMLNAGLMDPQAQLTSMGWLALGAGLVAIVWIGHLLTR